MMIKKFKPMFEKKFQFKKNMTKPVYKPPMVHFKSFSLFENPQIATGQ